MRKTKVLIDDYDDREPLEVDALMLTHKYDENCLYISLKDYFDNPEYSNEITTELLDEMHKFILSKSLTVRANFCFKFVIRLQRT